MVITASIVVYNTNRDELKNCIESMHKNAIKPIYVSDNSPNDDLRYYCSQFENVEYIYNNGNIGYGAGHNVAIRLAEKLCSDYHLVINSDVYFGEGVISKIIEYMEHSKDVGQLIPNTIYPDGELQDVVRLLPTPIDLVFRRFLPAIFSKKLDEKFLLKKWKHDTPINVPFHMGCFMFFRMSSLNEIGMFDENIFMYTEDIDITRRMHRKYKTMFWPDVTIVHNHLRGSYKNKRLLKIHIISAIKYFNKWGWLFDMERHLWNKELLKELGYVKKNWLIELWYKAK